VHFALRDQSVRVLPVSRRPSEEVGGSEEAGDDGTDGEGDGLSVIYRWIMTDIANKRVDYHSGFRRPWFF
jgi:hypothetical protein